MPLEDHQPLNFVGTAELRPIPRHPWIEVAVVLAAILGHLPALGAWWNMDDWGLLGRAAGLLGGEASFGFPARFLSQHLYWDLTFPLFGTSCDPYTWTRLLLHGLSAWLVIRIALRAGLGPWSRLIAGLMMAATPLVFTPLYWAAGIQELLAAALALVSVERWLAGGRRNLAWAVLAGALSMLAKESGLGLPLLFLVFLWLRLGVKIEDKAFAWAMTFFLLVFAVVEGTLVSFHFATGPEDPYALGGFRTVISNLGLFGWWLISPGPILASSVLWPMASAGLLLFVGWAVWGVNQWQQRNHLPGLTLISCLLVLGPALALKGQAHPYLAYLAVAPMGLALGSLFSDYRKLPVPALILVSVMAATWSFWSMDFRLSQRDSEGLPADPVVRATSISWQVCNSLLQLPLDRGQNGVPALTMLQIPASSEAAALADRLGDRWVAGTHLYEAIGGTTGPRLILGKQFGREVRVDWANALFSTPAEALVLCAHGPGFKHWGTTSNAAFFAALTDIGLGRFERARKHLIRASDLQRVQNDELETASFFYDPGQMVVPMNRVLEEKEPFIDWTLGLLEKGHSHWEVGGLQDMFLQLLVVGTGKTMEELTAGSQLMQRSSLDPEPVEPPGE